MDNPWLHTVRLSVEFFEDNQMETAPHPPYSPNIAPSGFYLSGYGKGCLASPLFMDAQELFNVVRAVIDSVKK
jgi:hypothetical protein